MIQSNENNELNRSEAPTNIPVLNLNLVGERYFHLPPCWFSLNNSETVKALNLAFCSSNFSLETFKPLTSPGLQILDTTHTEFLIKFIINKNCDNSSTSNDIDMKLEPVNLTRKTRQRQKSLTMVSCPKIMTSSSFFRLMVDLEQSGTQIPDAWFIIPAFFNRNYLPEATYLCVLTYQISTF